MDPRETAEAMYAGYSKLYHDAEDALTEAVRAADKTGEEFWRSVFREFCNLIGHNRFLDDVSWLIYGEADRYANGVNPSEGPSEAEETPCL